MSPAPVAPAAPSSALLIKIAARPDFTKVEQMPRGAERKAAAYDAILKNSTESQKAYVAIAEKLKASGAITGYSQLIGPNMLVVTPKAGANKDVIAAFSTDGVKSVWDNRAGLLWSPGGAAGANTGAHLVNKPNWGLDITGRKHLVPAAPTEAPYGLGLIGAQDAWKAGADGRGLVYGSIDTGVDVSHPAIKNAWRGTNADGTSSADYNWADTSAANSPKPVDGHGHGTHTIGTVLGKAADINIGVAPAAKFISAAGLSGTADAAVRALAWMQAPTKVDGTAPDATKAPDVVGMSWWMGSTSQDFFHESILNLRAAGIEVVKSAGNNGPGAGTISSPGQYPELYAIGAVDKDGNVANFSSRGPAPFPKGKTTAKPDFAAPGVGTLSSVPGNKYAAMSGTSMAQPHFSGAVLAILSKYPQLTHDQLTAVLTASAKDAGKPGHDAEYGAGVINIPGALVAAEKLLNGEKPAKPSRPGRPGPKAAVAA